MIRNKGLPWQRNSSVHCSAAFMARALRIGYEGECRRVRVRVKVRLRVRVRVRERVVGCEGVKGVMGESVGVRVRVWV